MKQLLAIFRRFLRWLDPAGAHGADLLLVTGHTSFLGALIGGLGALSGIMGARDQNRANARAWEPRPYESHETRNPWEPTIPYLSNILPMAGSVLAHNLSAPGPPGRGGGGPSQDFQDIVAAMRDRAMGSQFVPQAQQQITSFMSRPNSLLQGVYDRAMNYSNPYLNQLLQQGVGGGGLNQATPLFQSFLSGLLGGNTELGLPFMAPQLMSPMQRLSAAAAGKPEMKRI